MADSHYSQRLGKWLQLERSEASLKGGGWLDVVPKKLAGDKVGYHVKMCKDPNNSRAQDTLPGKALDTPREAWPPSVEQSGLPSILFLQGPLAARCARPLPHPFPNLIMCRVTHASRR